MYVSSRITKSLDMPVSTILGNLTHRCNAVEGLNRVGMFRGQQRLLERAQYAEGRERVTEHAFHI